MEQCVLVAVVMLLLGSVVVTQAQDQPHIVFVFLDDLGWNDVGYHGSEIMTPEIDNLAAQGRKLERYYGQPVCSPTRGSFLTGRYTTHTCLRNAPIDGGDLGGLALEETTLFEVLHDAGYTTHALGKWHLGMATEEFLPTYRGVDFFYGLYNGYGDHYEHTACSFRNPTICGGDLHEDEGTTLRPVTANGTYSTHLYTQRAVDIIQGHDASEPLFMYLSYTAPHTPLQAPQEYIDMYPDIQSLQRRSFAGMVTCADDGIANITSALQETGMWNNTIFIFSSDNGGSQAGDNDPLRGDKGAFYEGGIRMAGFITSPLLDLQDPGAEFQGLMHVTDWFPTLVNLAAGDAEGLELDGVDVWEALSENGVSPRTEILHIIDPSVGPVGDNTHADVFDVRVQAGLRSGEWKILTGSQGQPPWGPNIQLFNVEEDPTESTDVADLYPEVVELLLERLAVYNQTAVPPCLLESHLDEANPDNHGGNWMPWR